MMKFLRILKDVTAVVGGALAILLVFDPLARQTFQALPEQDQRVGTFFLVVWAVSSVQHCVKSIFDAVSEKS